MGQGSKKLTEFLLFGWDVEDRKQVCKACRIQGTTYKSGWKPWCNKTQSDECAIDRETSPRSVSLYASLSPRCWEVLRLWGRIQTQWRWAGMGSRAGLDYTAVVTTAQALDIDIDDEFLALLQIVEVEQLKRWGEEDKKKQSVQSKGSCAGQTNIGNGKLPMLGQR